ncbi:MAG: ABC transporter permease [Asgard group archaeon]|nr:ABC transporter permease [Asgard group archaeon]
MRFLERLKFYYKMLLLNRRNTLIMFLGLGISLAMISEGLIFMYSFQYNAFVNFNKQTPTKQFTISIGAFEVTDADENIVSKLNNMTQAVIEEMELESRILRTDWISQKGAMVFLKPNNPAQAEFDDGYMISDTVFYGLPPDYFSALGEMLYNGTLPHRINEALYVVDRAIIESTNLSQLGMFSVYVPMFSLPPDFYLPVKMGIPGGGNVLNITGVIAKEDFESYRANTTGLTEDINALEDYFSDSGFLISSHIAVQKYAQNVTYFEGYVGYQCRFSFDLSKIDAFNINQEIRTLNQLSQELTRKFQNADFDVNVYPELTDLLRDFREEFLIFQLFALLFITPLIGMALSLTSYSTNLMKRRQKRHVSNMLQRGSSRKEVLSFLVFQVIEFTILAVLTCIVIGYPFASLMIRSNGFLSFSGVSIFPAINMTIFYAIIGAAFVFSIAVNAKNIWDMSTISTTEAYGTTIQKKPIWERTYIDFILILVGVALWVIVSTQLRGSSAYSFAYGIGTTAPVCLILGGILLATRLYPYFVNFLAKLGWKSPKLGILGLSAKRSLRRKSAVIRSLVLISLTFTLIISSVTTIQSYKDYDSEQAYYQLGADILVRNVKISNDNIKNRVADIEGVEICSYIKYTSQITHYGSIVYSYLVIGIDPYEYAQIGYVENEYLDTNNATEFFSALKDSNDVIMQKDQIAVIDTYEGDSITLSAEKVGLGEVNYTLDVVGIYNFFPRFFTEYPEYGSTTFRFTVIGNYDLANELSYSEMRLVGDLLVKVTDGYDISEVSDAIEDELDRTVENVVDLMGIYDGSLRNTMLYGSLNTSFISSLVITISAISLMILIQSIENEMEVVMLKTLGMSPRQLFTLFTTEAMTLVTFGSIIGFALGLFSARMFMEILTIDTVLPPVEMILPPFQILLGFGLLFFTALGSAALTSWIIFRKDTIKAIKQI